MSNPSKQKGTAAETAVVRYCQSNGFPDAARIALNGRYDRGDILLCGSLARPEIVVEVKAHKTFSDGDVMVWLGQTEAERANAGAGHAFLVVKRPGKGEAQVSHWWAVELETIADGWQCRPVYRYLSDYLVQLRARGFGAAAS